MDEINGIVKKAANRISALKTERREAAEELSKINRHIECAEEGEANMIFSVLRKNFIENNPCLVHPSDSITQHAVALYNLLYRLTEPEHGNIPEQSKAGHATPEDLPILSEARELGLIEDIRLDNDALVPHLTRKGLGVAGRIRANYVYDYLERLKPCVNCGNGASASGDGQSAAES